MTKASVKRGHAGPPQHVPTELLQQVNQEAEIAGRLSLARMSEAVRKRFVLPSGVDIAFQHFWGHTMSAVQSLLRLQCKHSVLRWPLDKPRPQRRPRRRRRLRTRKQP
jgi:hypothetical protein